MPRGGFGMRGMGMMRRRGFPLLGPVPMMGGFGDGMGSPLLMALLSGGLGYSIGSSTAQRQVAEQQNARIGQIEQQQQQPQPALQYQVYAPPQVAPAAPAVSTESDKLAQLKLLSQLRESGVLTAAEFEAEKQKVLRG